MTDTFELGGTADRHARWVEMWRHAVRASREAMAVIEVSTARFIELSRRAADLLGTPQEEGSGLDYLSVVGRPRDAAETFRLVRAGLLDGLQARRWYRRPDGARFEVETSGWAIRSFDGPDLGLWAAREVRSETDRTDTAHEVIPALPWRSTTSDSERVGLTVDHGWRISQISSNTGSLLGWSRAESVGSSILELTHPVDLATLLFAFARATTEASVGVRIRLRHQDGTWRTIRVAPTALQGDEDETPPFALVLDYHEEVESTVASGEAIKLAGHLRRLASQIEASGLLIETTHPIGVPLKAELTPREWEVVLHLVRGERVATIAATMYLSPSTVRNHLSAIFRKVGVHSQQEFLTLWGRGAGRRTN